MRFDHRQELFEKYGSNLFLCRISKIKIYECFTYDGLIKCGI